MSSSRAAAFAAGTLGTFTILAGCAGSPIGSPSTSVGATSSLPASGLRAWMAPDAQSSDLLYISEQGNLVSVFSYPRGKPIGFLTGLNRPGGECVDKAGDVFITNTNGHDVLEYAHGGTTPIATLSDSNYYPYGCSIDPVTGNLAVSNLYTTEGGSGGVSIYPGAAGAPTTYSNPAIFYYFFCGYDRRGNLFVDGQSASSAFAFAELRKGAKALKPLGLNQSIQYPAGVQWDGKHVAVGDRDANVIYEFTIGKSGGTKVGSTPLAGANQVNQFFIAGKTLIGPEAGSADVGFWKYPAGGAAFKTIGGLEVPVGAVVSAAVP
jgi:hypothetical protein